LSSDLDPQVRVEHLLRALPIAKQRFDDCAAHLNAAQVPDGTQAASGPQTAGGTQVPAALQGLQNEWNDADKIRFRRSLLQDPATQDNMTKLIFQTEEITSRVCGAPSGDDALLLQLANSSPEGH